MVYRIVALGFAILFLSGCVVGRKHDFQEAQAVLDYHGQPLALGVQELRSSVVSGDKGEDFAGLARSGYGIPYDIGTESDRPLAQEMADVIAAALRGSGATVKIVALSPNMGRTEVIRAMTSTGTDQSLLLSVREWKTDTYGATGLEYGLELEALDAQGQVLAARSLLRRRLAGAKRIEVVLKPEAARALRRPAEADWKHLLDDHRGGAAGRRGSPIPPGRP